MFTFCPVRLDQLKVHVNVALVPGAIKPGKMAVAFWFISISVTFAVSSEYALFVRFTVKLPRSFKSKCTSLTSAAYFAGVLAV